MQGHPVNNPIKVGRVFAVRGSRSALPSVASAVDRTWVELLSSDGQHQARELVLHGRALTLPGFAATGVDLGGELVVSRGCTAAVRGLQRGPLRADRATAQQDLRALLRAALLDLIAQTQMEGAPPATRGGTLTRQEAAAWARVRVQRIDYYRARQVFSWTVQDGRIAIDADSFERWLVAKLQRERG